ncbi:MAG: glycosyltransferase [Patescibacteria group bacterium]|jgi:glycosyltransferase involved in cell wall biosynthesis|nr:glycosyltransferase [Patescibacteria group bacterium]
MKKVALVHDFLTSYGGAESVLKELGEIHPNASVYTMLQEDDVLNKFGEKWFSKREIHTSFLQKFPKFIKKRKKFLLPFMTVAPETFNLRDFDLVISSSGAFSKGIIVKPKTIHICYMHSPMRYAWDWHHNYLEENKLKGKMKLFTRFVLNYVRMWDRASAQRPDFLVANSSYTASRIKKYYGRESKVIYPPVKIDDIKPQKENKGYFLVVARLSAYKRIDVIISAFQKLDLPLIIIGEGVERERLEDQIRKGKNSQIKLLGWKEREDLAILYQNARAFVFAAEEDFGIVATEAMAAGKPVLALNKGGLREIVKEGVSGLFFEEAMMELIADAVRRFINQEKDFNFETIRKEAEKFSTERFRREFQEYVNSVISN